MNEFVPNSMGKKQFAQLCGFATTYSVYRKIYQNTDLLNELYATQTWEPNRRTWNHKELIILQKYFGITFTTNRK